MPEERMHFWVRIEGDVSSEVFRDKPLARLDDGRIVEYHMAGKRDEVERLLRTSTFHWRYLGQGVFYTIDGVTQFANALQTRRSIR